MFKGLLSKVVGGSNDREIAKLNPLVEAINALEPEMEQRSDAGLRALTGQFRARLASGEGLDDIMVEAFAAVREVAKRTVDMRPFDVQLIGAIVLHQGNVAEMRTGEGKTLVATMPVYLNALTGRGVHLITVNDYLARRDALWMSPIYQLMGLSVGLLQSGAEQPAYVVDPEYQRDPYPGLRPVPRREAYGADITYGTNNEFGFDYLRDNLALALERRVQRPLYYAIVDEVDNIFIDEARTPLIISGPSGEPVEEYSRFAAIARKLEPDVHYELEEKERNVFLTEEGLAVVEQETGIENIYDEANYRLVHYMQQALKAQVLFLEGRHYIRQRKRIILIDQHTGRLMPSRRLSEGLHQAIEAKEAVPVRPRDVTSATITIQNYFRMYEKLAGMSGTAVTEAEEFFKIYELDVLAIPTNKPVIRKDHSDVVYRSEESKLRAVAREIMACHSRSQPVLVGTTSVEMSERLSKRLTGERLQAAALAPQVAYALQDMDLERDERDALRETMNDSLETMNSASWRRLVRAVGLNPNALNPENLGWIARYMELPDDAQVRHVLERSLREGIPHEILNAKEHTREASIIAGAGEPGSVTIATNMAGRGVDIKLGGDLTDEVSHRVHLALEARGLDPFNATPAQTDSAIAEVVPQYAKRRDQVLAAEGLHVLGTARHEARRIDNQLRGRSGRQGEPGSSRFYLSLEDDLLRRFGRKEMLAKLMEQIGDDFPIEHNLVSRTLERAQTSVEGYNFDIRKHLLEYDDVLNRQRETIYGERLRILKSDDLRDEVWRMLEGQVDEYLEKYGEDPEQQRLLYTGLDDVVPLTLQAAGATFPGPVSFGGHLTAFPPFSISFLAQQLAGQPLDAAQQVLDDLPWQASASFGDYLGQTVAGIARATLEKYDERLERYQALLDEKIEDFVQLAEERGQPPDIRRLAQHLERTYPLALTTPRDSYQWSGDDLREHWLGEVEIAFHRQTCAGLLDRVQVRMPADVNLDRLRAARIPTAKLVDELGRVSKLAAKQARDDAARQQLAAFSLSADPTASEVHEFLTTVKGASNLDFGRLDRLVGHVLGAQLDDLISQYMAAADESQGRIRRNLEQLQGTVVEGKKGGRPNQLLSVLRELNDMVHLEIPAMESLLTLAVEHEYDKWAQRQLTEIQTATTRQSLADTSWVSIAEHLLAIHYTQKQAYDRGHRRVTSWLPRLPFGYIAQAYAEQLDPEALREAILDGLRWAVEQREQSWGQQEFQHWNDLSLQDLDIETHGSLLRYLGEQDLGDQRDQEIDALEPALYDRLRFILALRQVQDRRLANLPQGQALVSHLGEALASEMLETPIDDLDDDSKQRIATYLNQSGYLDDASAREKLIQQPVQDWDQRTTEQVASLLGRKYIQAHQGQALSGLAPWALETASAYLQKQRYFVDEDQVQRFLVHQRLSDLPAETHQAALERLAQTRLDRLKQRKISNLDVKSRQIVMTSLQRAGMFTDHARRKELLAHSLSELEPKVRTGFGTFLARQQMENEGLDALDGAAREYVIAELRQSDVLVAPGRMEGLEQQHLAELDESVATQIRDEMVAQLRADLASKTMEELPGETRQQIHRTLDEQNYFVDQDRVSWYERNTLAQLAPDLLRGLEQHLGRIRLQELADAPFSGLPAETQSSLNNLFDSERLLTDRAERLRITQTGTLGQLPDNARDAVIKHLGRQWLVQIRNQRPPTLPDDARTEVWVYLREQGLFEDTFKEELFAYQRVDEFDAKAQAAVKDALIDRLLSTLDSQPVGSLSPDLQTEIRARLRQTDVLIDQERLQQATHLPLQELPPELGQAIQASLGEYLLAELGTPPLSELSPDVQAALWRYLDEIGYFVDEKKQAQILQRRLVDLGNEILESVIQDFIAHQEIEIGDRPVSDLDDEMRQRLREAVEATGFFESEKEKAQVLSHPLDDLRREDLEPLAIELGHTQLEEWAGDRLADRPQADQEQILSHLQAHDWFVDRKRYDQIQKQSLADLDPSISEPLEMKLRDQEAARLGEQRLSDLPGKQHQIARAFLRDQGLALDEGQMRSVRKTKLRDLDPDAYYDVLHDLGEEAVTRWTATRFSELEDKQKDIVGAFLGRRIMAQIERRILLHTISRLWVDYLTDIEDLRRGIGLEAYGQRDPLIEYKRRAYELFEELGDNIRRTVIRSVFRQPPASLVAQRTVSSQ